MTDMSIALHITPPQAEKKAAKELRRDGVKAYVPRMRMKKRVSHHQKAERTVTKILAPGYVLAKGNARYRQYVRGKIGGITPAEALRLLKHGRKLSKATSNPHKTWAVGDIVKIKVGPFADLVGKITRDAGRCVIVEHESGKTIAVSTYHLTRPHE